MHLDAGPSLHSISIGPASAANAGGFLQVVESKARTHATLCARLASSRFRFNAKTYQELAHPSGLLGIGEPYSGDQSQSAFSYILPFRFVGYLARRSRTGTLT